jgi:signal transduction histidine kinase
VAAAGAVVLYEARRQRRRASSAEALDVVSAVSHELRSPLTSIQGYTSMLMNRWDRFTDEQKRQLLTEMHEDAGRVGRMVGELLDVSRLETGRLALHHQRVDLAAIARAAVERVAIEHPELVATVEFPDDWPVVRGDPDKLQQVLLNLVENAAKYADPRAVRVVGARPDAGHVSVSVIDRGEGIPPDELDRVFTKFFRREDQRPSGIGLGLWISRGVMEAHGGTLTASSKMGAGSEFCLTLPVT